LLRHAVLIFIIAAALYFTLAAFAAASSVCDCMGGARR
jgi:hypothetical protein